MMWPGIMMVYAFLIAIAFGVGQAVEAAVVFWV